MNIIEKFWVQFYKWFQIGPHFWGGGLKKIPFTMYYFQWIDHPTEGMKMLNYRIGIINHTRSAVYWTLFHAYQSQHIQIIMNSHLVRKVKFPKISGLKIQIWYLIYKFALSLCFMRIAPRIFPLKYKKFVWFLKTHKDWFYY